MWLSDNIKDHFARKSNMSITLKYIGGSIRYILSANFSEASGEAWFSVFSEEAEKIIDWSVDELDKMKSQDDLTEFQTQLKKVTWVPHLFRVMVAPVDFAAESKFLLDEISSMKV
uniref:replication protein A 70 kDa DNA-binding subunit D-like n=1 Tax=Erigeron canadensis TaxID=72917 RepID=UPI001CB981FB|nr:replication protein A 70 kDa DNA-binding subunit D-like [Erigeron canadensis]XP_043622796.1 replication protein A 70 kDa DNA-binding subunit D-like [Erigeron canadensis]XP_043622797.1 replication protein A 70 kDa DNA-binding subunit D-like [Erigeron canadensis]